PRGVDEPVGSRWRGSPARLQRSRNRSLVAGRTECTVRTRRETRGRFGVWRVRGAGDSLSDRVLSVVATKIRTSREGGGMMSTVGRIYEGFLLSEPTVGRGMVIFR